MINSKKNLLWFVPSAVITVVFALPIFSAEHLNRVVDFLEIYPAAAPAVVILFSGFIFFFFGGIAFKYSMYLFASFVISFLVALLVMRCTAPFLALSELGAPVRKKRSSAKELGTKNYG